MNKTGSKCYVYGNACLGIFRSFHDIGSSTTNCMVELTNWKFSLFDVISATHVLPMNKKWKWNVLVLDIRYYVVGLLGFWPITYIQSCTLYILTLSNE